MSLSRAADVADRGRLVAVVNEDEEMAGIMLVVILAAVDGGVGVVGKTLDDSIAGPLILLFPLSLSLFAAVRKELALIMVGP